MSDQRQLSQRYQYNVKGEFMRLWNQERENALIFYQIPSTKSLRKYVEINLKNLHGNIGT